MVSEYKTFDGYQLSIIDTHIGIFIGTDIKVSMGSTVIEVKWMHNICQFQEISLICVA